MFQTADLSDKYGAKAQCVAPIFKSYGGKKKMSGAIVTIKCFEDNSLVKTTLQQPGDGKILVVDAGGSKRCAMLGDMIAQNAVDNNWQGVLMYGLVRDSLILSQMDLGVWALGTLPLKSVKLGVGQKDILLQFAGVKFNPGNYLYADTDGIIIIDKKDQDND